MDIDEELIRMLLHLTYTNRVSMDRLVSVHTDTVSVLTDTQYQHYQLVPYIYQPVHTDTVSVHTDTQYQHYRLVPYIYRPYTCIGISQIGKYQVYKLVAKTFDSN